MNVYLYVQMKIFIYARGRKNGEKQLKKLNIQMKTVSEAPVQTAKIQGYLKVTGDRVANDGW